MRKLLLITTSLLALSACGFQLKGQQPYDRLPYQAWQVDGGELQQPLENALRRADAQSVGASDAQAAITVTHLGTERNVLTSTRAASINEYMLVLRVTAQASRNGEPLGEPMEIVVRRPMEYADSEILGKGEEEAMIWQDMRRDAAQQIVRRLGFLKAQ